MSLLAVLGSASSHGGTVITSCSTVLADGSFIARIGDQHSCPIPHHGVTPIVTGSSTVFVEGAPAARVGDSTGCGAIIVEGALDVLAGG